MKSTTQKFFLAMMFAILFSTVSFSQTSSSQTKKVKPTIVLVHGLWADGSAWNKVTTALQAQGYLVIAVQNPTTSLTDDVAATNKAIDRATGDVVLVGHSWGGFVIGEAGLSSKVKALVYVAALVPDKGETLPSLSAKAPATELGKYLQNNDGFLTLTKEGVQKAFAGDVTAREQNLIFATQPPASQSVFTAMAENIAWKTKPAFYLVAKKDKAINPELERIMAKRANATTVEADASHVPMISKPTAVIKLIQQAAASF